MQNSLLAIQSELRTIEMGIVPLLDFFDAVVVCITSKVCDDTETVAKFGKPIRVVKAKSHLGQ